MGFNFIRLLPTPQEIREEYPLPPTLLQIKEQRDREIKDVITGVSNKFLVIIGPCSADNRITSYNVCYTKLLRFTLISSTDFLFNILDTLHKI